MSNNENKRGRKKIEFYVGQGVKTQPIEKYTHLGKVIIHKPLLYRSNRVSIKYPSGCHIKDFPSRLVSNGIAQLIKHVLETGNLNQKLFSELSMTDKNYFNALMGRCGLADQLGISDYLNGSDETDIKRFELLKGIVLAGSNAPETLNELKLLILKFMTNGMMKKPEGNQLLLELNSLL